MSDFIFHLAMVIRGKELVVAGMFTSKNDAEHFASELRKTEPLGVHLGAQNIEGVKKMFLKERLGELHGVLLRLEQHEKSRIALDASAKMFFGGRPMAQETTRRDSQAPT